MYILDSKNCVVFTGFVAGAVEIFFNNNVPSIKQTQASNRWCGFSLPQCKFPSFRMWGKLDNQYSWPTGSAKLLWLATPREMPFSLPWEICKVSRPKWLELLSLTKGLREQIKNWFPCFPAFSSDSCGHFCWCQLQSLQLSPLFSYRDGWLSSPQEQWSITYAYGWSRPCLWLQIWQE